MHSLDKIAEIKNGRQLNKTDGHFFFENNYDAAGS